MKLLKVKRAHESAWHYALDAELRPVCGCGCASPRKPKRRGAEGVCACRCHDYGLLWTLSLCEKLAQRRGSLAESLRARAEKADRQLGLFTGARGQAEKSIVNSESRVARVPWRVMTGGGGGKGCQLCRKLGAQLTKAEVEWTMAKINGESA